MKKLMMILALACFAPLAAQAATPAEQRAAIQKMEADTLNRLFAERPDTRNEIENAVGYAVFSSGSLAVLFVSAGAGHGVAHDNRGGEDIYMQMATAGVGLGLGAKDFNTVFIFHDPAAFSDFTTVGLDLSGNADAAAKVGAKGEAASGSVDILSGVNIYQLTDAGLLAQAMIQGTKYWRDNDLNRGGDLSYNAPPPRRAYNENARYNQ